MHKHLMWLPIGLLFGVSVMWPASAHAVIPPDFVFSIAAQVTQVFSMLLIFFSAVFGAFFQFFQAKAVALHLTKLKVALIVLLLVVLSLLGAYVYAIYKQKSEYQKWLLESNKYTTAQNAPLKNADGSASSDLNGLGAVGDAVASNDANDQLAVGTNTSASVDTSKSKFVSSVTTTDDSSKFITTYYERIANGQYEQAYAQSKQSVDLATFKSWYAKTTKITLDKLVRIDDKRSSLELTLYEGDAFTRYGVLMTLALDSGRPVKIEQSVVKVLAEGSLSQVPSPTQSAQPSSDEAYFDSNQTASTVISNQAFKTKTDSSSADYYVLDARENIEYDNGYFPGSTHIRFADLKAGRWIELPKDKPVYVICWSGIRGKEVAEFLRTKKILASYLEKGANGWVDFGGKWSGSIKFVEKYTDVKYQRVFTTDETKAKVKEGVFLVDTREPARFAQSHIAGSVNIPIMYTATNDLEKAFAQVPPGSQVITVCDGYVNCFDAKITGVELERRGHTFIGRYNKPWEYGQ